MFLIGILCQVFICWMKDFFLTTSSGFVGIILWPSGIADIWVPVGWTGNNYAHSFSELFELEKNSVQGFDSTIPVLGSVTLLCLPSQKFCIVNWERSVPLKDVSALL